MMAQSLAIPDAAGGPEREAIPKWQYGTIQKPGRPRRRRSVLMVFLFFDINGKPTALWQSRLLAPNRVAF